MQYPKAFGDGQPILVVDPGIADPDTAAFWFESFLGAAIKICRLHKGISQEALAASLGKSQRYICRVENGHTSVSIQRMVDFCRALGCRPSDLVGYAEELASHDARPEADVKADLKRATLDLLKEKGYSASSSKGEGTTASAPKDRVQANRRQKRSDRAALFGH